MKLKYVILIMLIGIITYLPSFFGTFVWDDEDFVFENVSVATHLYGKFFTEQAIAGRGKLSNYYRPIQMSAYALIHQAFGFNPGIYHAVNIITHIAATLALFWFITALIPTPVGWSSYTPVLFLIHPLQTEAVSYISGLSDPLVALFGFLTLVFFLKSKDRPLFLPFSLIAFILSLLSKEIGIAFFGVLVLLAVLKKRPILTLLPFGLTSIIYLLFHLQVVNVLDMAKVWGSTPYVSSVFVRIATFIQNIFFYLGLFFFPKDLHMERDLTTPIQLSLFNPFTFGFILLLGIGVIYFWKKRKDEKTPLQLFTLAGFFLTLLPYSGIILINGIFYEHFMYIPIAFLSLFAILALQHLGEHIIASHSKSNVVNILRDLSLRDPATWRGAAIFPKSPSLRGIFDVAIFGICTLFILRSYLRQYEWTNPIRFYTQTLSFAPDSIRIRNGLGMAYMDTKEYDKALTTFDDVISRDPHVPNSYHNKGNIYVAQGKYTEAELAYKKALDVDPSFTFSLLALYKLFTDTHQIEKRSTLIKSYPRILNSE